MHYFILEFIAFLGLIIFMKLDQIKFLKMIFRSVYDMTLNGCFGHICDFRKKTI